MSFLAPYLFLGGLVAAGIPVALHFFYRSRYRTVPWAAMKFLLDSIEQTSRRLRFQELLLLLLRVALLVLLGLALARPSSHVAGGGGRGDAVDAVLIIDNSMSMGARAGVAPPPAGSSSDPYLSALKEFAAPDGSVTCLDRARAAALAVLASLPPYSTVQVVTSSDRAGLLGPRTSSHLDQARKLIQEVELTHLGTDFLPAVTEAAGILEKGPSPNKELYLFSDMQKRGWEAQAAALAAKLQDVKQSAGVHLVACSTRPPANVAIVGITAQSTLRTGERADFAVLVRNTGAGAVRNLAVSLEVDAQEGGRRPLKDTQPLLEIKPGETLPVLLSAALGRPGRRVLTATVRPDDLEADNRFDRVIQVHDRVGVLVVDGAPDPRDPRKSASYFLQHALNAGGSEAAPPVTSVWAGLAAPRDLPDKDLCILVNARLEPKGREEGGSLSPEFVRALAGFVQDGHSLLIFPGDRVDPESYNRLLFEQQQLLPLKIASVKDPAGGPWALDRDSAVDPFARFRKESAYASINRIEVRRALVLEEPGGEETRVLLRYRNGRPAVASRRAAGQGEVMLFTTAVHDAEWSSWFLSSAVGFVPIVHMTLEHLLGGRTGTLNRTAGETLTWQVARADASRSHDLVRPDGTRVRLGYAESVAGRPLLTANDTVRAGVYRIVPADGRPAAEGDAGGVPFAVTPDPRESENLEVFKPAEVDELLGFRAVHLSAGDDGAAFSGAARLRREWTEWLLLALLVLVLAESVLAWFCGRAW